jgi:hypothetical protein
VWLWARVQGTRCQRQNLDSSDQECRDSTVAPQGRCAAPPGGLVQIGRDSRYTQHRSMAYFLGVEMKVVIAMLRSVISTVNVSH